MLEIIITIIISAALTAAVTAVIVSQYHKKTTEATIGNAQDKARKSSMKLSRLQNPRSANLFWK